MPAKRYLMTPGPTPVPPEVLAAMAAPVVHHRGPDFRIVYDRCLGRLREVCRPDSDVQALAQVAKEAGALVAVDAISSLGALPLETDAWGLDAVASGSQKALMTPPGLALVAVSDAALVASARATSPRFYVDWERIRE